MSDSASVQDIMHFHTEPEAHKTPPNSDTKAPKRKASAADLDGTLANAPSHARPVKRRASKACRCCRARKVRCNVTEHGAPCTNCRLDNVECIVSESRRIKKWSKDDEAANEGAEDPSPSGRDCGSRTNALDGLQVRTSASRKSHDLHREAQHVPHSIYRTHGQPINGPIPVNEAETAFPLPLLANCPLDQRPRYLHVAPPSLPYYIKPLPARVGPDEAAYLEKKGALTIPAVPLRNELIKAYIEFVHPFMPLLDLCDFVMIVESDNGSLGRVSLILFQAVMFAGSAFCDMEQLSAAGYLTRKEARKDFFQKTRLLYDFDYEQDRLALVQALLLLTYYYETPDDQKDTWHWMGVATSVAHTIGLHRNPQKSRMDAKRLKLWKRMWWSHYMRDRLIALGMRRPTRIKNGDFDVPMLSLDDFELVAIPASVTCVPMGTLLARNVEHQRQMAIMCMAKARLCLCISHVLSKQYCVLNNHEGMTNDRTTMLLLPKKCGPETDEVRACDDELQKWLESLPEEAKYGETLSGNPAIDLNRGLLHMVFFTTLSALHRPQVLPSGHPSPEKERNDTPIELLAMSRRNVRRAAFAITHIVQQLDSHNLVRFLPTTGVTVLLPAIIIHLLDIKSPDEETRRNSLRGFCQCMQVMSKLRDIYAAADYSTAFLEAAIRKAGIQLATAQQQFVNPAETTNSPDGVYISPDADTKSQIMSVEALVNAGKRLELIGTQGPPKQTMKASAASLKIPRTITPPPDAALGHFTVEAGVTDEEVARRLETFLASTPPDSDHNPSDTGSAITSGGKNHNSTQAFFKPNRDFISAGGGGTTNASAGQHRDAKRHPRANVSLAPVPGQLQHPNGNVTGIMLDLTNDVLFPIWQNIAPEVDESDFDSLLNLDAMGETFSFDEGLEAAVRLQDQGLGAGLGGAGWR